MEKEIVKAEHNIGDPIHAKIYYADDRACLVCIGRVLDSRLHAGTLFPDRILYDIELEQVDAPPVLITNLTRGFVLLGGREVFDEKTGAYIGDDPREKKSLLPALGEILKPGQTLKSPWVRVENGLPNDSKTVAARFKEGDEYKYSSITHEDDRVFIGDEDTMYNENSPSLNGWEWLDESGS